MSLGNYFSVLLFSDHSNDMVLENNVHYHEILELLYNSNTVSKIKGSSLGINSLKQIKEGVFK